MPSPPLEILIEVTWSRDSSGDFFLRFQVIAMASPSEKQLYFFKSDCSPCASEICRIHDQRQLPEPYPRPTEL